MYSQSAKKENINLGPKEFPKFSSIKILEFTHASYLTLVSISPSNAFESLSSFNQKKLSYHLHIS